MLYYRKFIRENEIYLVIARKELDESFISELREIVESNKDAGKIYVITKKNFFKCCKLLEGLWCDSN